MRRKLLATLAMAVSAAMLLVGATQLISSFRHPNAAIVESVGERGATPAPTSIQDAPTGGPPRPTRQAAVGRDSAGVASRERPVQDPHPGDRGGPDILPVSLDQANAVVVPDDITKVGWYEYAAAPGSAQGSAVLVAHRDGRVQGHGVFYDLGLLDVGDLVRVTNDAGELLRFRVVARELLQKSAFGDAAADLFAVDGRPRLTLISCGGYYDRDAGGYQANVVVTAVPETSAQG